MALYHHDQRDYAAAAASAGQFARNKIDSLLENGRGRAMAVLEKISNEVPNDYVAAGPQIFWGAGHNGLDVMVGESEVLSVHSHALGQAAGYVGIPTRYARMLDSTEGWGQELLAHNLNALYGRSPKRHLIREVDGEVRGIMSDKYKRLDSRPIVEAFAQEAAALGAVPIEGYALDTKVALKALLPTIYEPVENEIMAFGMVLQNSDFGHGALSLRLFMMRLWCTNYAIAEERLRKVHLGGRLPDDMEFSEETRNLETAATISAMRDVVRNGMGQEHINDIMAGIKAAHEANISATEVKAFLKSHLSKTEVNAVTEAFISAEVEMLPPGQNRWRLSNAISWIAGDTVDEVRRLELQQVAARALPQIAPGTGGQFTVIDTSAQAPAPAAEPELSDDVNARFIGLELDE